MLQAIQALRQQGEVVICADDKDDASVLACDRQLLKQADSYQVQSLA